VTGKPKTSTSRIQVLPDIDLRQTRFRMDCDIFHIKTEIQILSWIHTK